MDKLNEVPILIIGAGPAGVSAGIYSIRNGVKPVIFHTHVSKIQEAAIIDNYYGFPNGIAGDELYNLGLEQAKNLGLEVKYAEVYKIEFLNEKIMKFEVSYLDLEDNINKKIKCRSIILATGNKNQNPNIKGFNEFIGKGISYCAVCDGFFYKDKKIGVIGNGQFALSEIKTLMNNTKDIIALTDGQSDYSFKKMLKQENIDILVIDKKIQSVFGNNKLEGIKFDDGSTLNLDGLFIALGQASSIDFAKTLGIILNGNNICVNEKMLTNIPGIYAAGDCTGGLNQVEKAVYQGATAGLDASTIIKVADITNKNKNK